MVVKTGVKNNMYLHIINEVAFAPTVSLKTYGFLTSFSPVWRGDLLKTSTECKIFDFKQQENLWLLLLF